MMIMLEYFNKTVVSDGDDNQNFEDNVDDDNDDDDWDDNDDDDDDEGNGDGKVCNLEKHAIGAIGALGAHLNIAIQLQQIKSCNA